MYEQIQETTGIEENFRPSRLSSVTYSQQHRSPSFNKRRPLEVIANLFGRKSKEKLASHQNETRPCLSPPDCSNRRMSTPILIGRSQQSDNSLCKQSRSVRERRAPCTRTGLSLSSCAHTSVCSTGEESDRFRSYSSLFSNSPVSPRVKSIDEDIEALTLSRQDNPFIQSQLERLSAASGLCCDFLSVSALSLTSSPQGEQTVTCSPSLVAGSNEHNEHSTTAMSGSLLSIELDEVLGDCSVHDHLVRSPPPQFPQKLTEFLFPAVGSPIRSLSLKRARQRSACESQHLQTSGTLLSPLRCKSATHRTENTSLPLRAGPLASSTGAFVDSQ